MLYNLRALRGCPPLEGVAENAVRRLEPGGDFPLIQTELKMKILVSACLVGDNCKYNGGNNLNERLVEFLAAHEVVKVCPEVLGGLATPRAPAEIQKGQVVNTEGRNVTKEFEAGALRALEIVEKEYPSILA